MGLYWQGLDAIATVKPDGDVKPPRHAAPAANAAANPEVTTPV
jgi:hypothetical protein